MSMERDSLYVKQVGPDLQPGLCVTKADRYQERRCETPHVNILIFWGAFGKRWHA